MCGALRVFAGTLLACLAVAACAEVDTAPAGHPRMLALPTDDAPTVGADRSSLDPDADAAGVEVEVRRPPGWPDRVVLGIQGAVTATTARQVLADLIEGELHVEVSIVSLRDLTSDDAPARLTGLDVVVGDAAAAHAAGFDGRLHTVQGAATGSATAWVTFAPDVWCPHGVLPVAGDGLAGCVEGGAPVGASGDGDAPGGLAALEDRFDGRAVIVPAVSSTAARLATLQLERELGAAPDGLQRVSGGDLSADSLWLVAVERRPDGVTTVGSWGPAGDGDLVIVAWGPWVPHAVVAVGPGIHGDLADALDEVLLDVSGHLAAAAALVDLAGVEGFATIDDGLWDVLGGVHD